MACATGNSTLPNRVVVRLTGSCNKCHIVVAASIAAATARPPSRLTSVRTQSMVGLFLVLSTLRLAAGATRAGLVRQPAFLLQHLAQEELDLAVQAAQVIVGPALNSFEHL